MCKKQTLLGCLAWGGEDRQGWGRFLQDLVWSQPQGVGVGQGEMEEAVLSARKKTRGSAGGSEAGSC